MEDLYFKSETMRTIFGLVELNGKQQMDFLGININHYLDKKKARQWFLETKEKLKNTFHPKLFVALENLEKLYKDMK